MTPYLSADWFRLWKAALAEAERLDMNLWIYDENSYPSGFAGGWVPEAMPEVARPRPGLPAKKRGAGGPGRRAGRLSASTARRLENVTAKARRGEAAARRTATWWSPWCAPANSPWHGNRCYVDLLYPGVTEKFLDVTLEAYRREIGEEFGRRVPGSFTRRAEHPPGRRTALDRTPAAGVPEALGLQPHRSICPA